MMQPSGRTMHNGKVYELWGDELWEYSPDVETGEPTVRVVGQVGILPATDSVRDAAADMLAALELAIEQIGYTFPDAIRDPMKAAIAKARGA